MTDVFGEKLKKIREAKGLRQADVGSAVGVSATAILQYEKHKREPSFDLIDRLADFFEVPVMYFFTETDVPRLNALAEKYGKLLSSPDIQAVLDEIASRPESEQDRIAKAFLAMLNVTR